VTAGAVLGVDIGTSSSKGLLVGMDGQILATAVREHQPDRPLPGRVEMDADLWWQEFRQISRDVLSSFSGRLAAVGVSGMGPCVLVSDEDNKPLRPAILYGIDTRALQEIHDLTEELGGDGPILSRCGSTLSTQAAGPKLRWIARHEPEIAAQARRLFMPSSWLVHQLTGSYVLDHHSASQCTPMYDTDAHAWYLPWAARVAPGMDLPELMWPGDIAGRVTQAASAATGIPAGTPVITGTIDAWSEAISVDGHNSGDLMLMYGTTMFLINTVESRVSAPAMWGTVGALKGTRNLAGGMATSGAITGWLKDLFGSPDYSELTALAAAAGPGANGLLMLPYFAGERTPIADPDARGIIAGLTISHGRGDLYRAALEATAFGVRHNIEALREAGGQIDRIIAVGGGTTGALWPQIVSDVTGMTQIITEKTVGASFGAAYLAAASQAEVDIRQWNPPAMEVRPDPAAREVYDGLYGLYRQLYENTKQIAHSLAGLQGRTSRPTADANP
jgi:xylulokinase